MINTYLCLNIVFEVHLVFFMCLLHKTVFVDKWNSYFVPIYPSGLPADSIEALKGKKYVE